MAVTIAHLSDLHFGMTRQAETWQALKRFLIGFKPDLVLVTGDLADSAQENDINLAARGLADLRDTGLACYVCPGNHDRHLQGISTTGIPWAVGSTATNLIKHIWNKNSKARDPKTRDKAGPVNSAFFDCQFNKLGMVVPEGAAVDLRLPKDAGDTLGAQWRVRLLALDSSSQAEYLAQGFVDPKMLENFRASARYAGPDKEAPDLVIVLMHHHLLPVPALEQPQRQSIGGLFASTILLNAGTVLSTLVDVGADIVLHGHEHAKHLARYGSMIAGRTDLAVIGAASATGAHTEHGSRIEHSAFNAIHLGDELNVTMSEYRYEAGTWKPQPSPQHLLGAVDIRRGRYLRKRANEKYPPAMPSSRVLKQFTYTMSRDAVIRQVTTNCVIRERRFSVETENASGIPYFMGGTVELPSGETVSLAAGEAPMPMRHGNIRVHEQVLTNLATSQAVVRRIEHEIAWLAGGVLTTDDLKRCAASQRDTFRGQGREFVEMVVEESLESLTLAIELPQGFGPRYRSDVDVFIRTPDRELIQRPELCERLRFSGLNRIAVNIPFPMAGYSYLVAWHLPTLPTIDPKHEAIYARILPLARGVAHRIAANLERLARGPTFSVGIYIPAEGSSGLIFRLVGHTAEGLPTTVAPTSNQHPFCSAHWGVPKVVAVAQPGQLTSEELSAGVQANEGGLLVLPLPSFFGTSAPTPGIARVAWPVGQPGDALEDLLLRAAAAVQGSSEQLFDLLR